MLYQAEDDHFLQWSIYGLHWLSLCKRGAQANRSPLYTGNSTPLYEIASDVSEIQWKPLNDYFFSQSTVASHKMGTIQLLSCALRWAFHRCMRVDSLFYSDYIDRGEAKVVLNMVSPEGKQLAIRQTEAAQPGAKIVYTSDQRKWFDISRWRQIKPVNPLAAAGGTYPLSRGSYYDNVYRESLEAVEAAESKPSHWEPPCGTASDDLAEYVSAQHMNKEKNK